MYGTVVSQESMCDLIIRCFRDKSGNLFSKERLMNILSDVEKGEDAVLTWMVDMEVENIRKSLREGGNNYS
jgi:DNA-binding response OmpR family regulator